MWSVFDNSIRHTPYIWLVESAIKMYHIVFGETCCRGDRDRMMRCDGSTFRGVRKFPVLFTPGYTFSCNEMVDGTAVNYSTVKV